MTVTISVDDLKAGNIIVGNHYVFFHAGDSNVRERTDNKLYLVLEKPNVSKISAVLCLNSMRKGYLLVHGVVLKFIA